MFVVFDSNIWISQRGLKSKAAVEVKEFINAKGATLVVPEVVKIEVERKIREELKKQRDTIKASRHYLAMLLGGVDDMLLPTDVQIDSCVSSLVEDTGVKLKHMPLTVEAAKSSFNKILCKTQPSDSKKEQFADGVIWANCLELLEDSDVYLVSEDQAFFKDKNYERGLAPNLAVEAKQWKNKLKLFPNLKRLLQDERQDISRVLPEEESNEIKHEGYGQGHKKEPH